MTRIFISYRRDPDSGLARLLYDRLIKVFDTSNVFMDVTNIPAGREFPNYILTQIAKCDVFIIMISERAFDDRINAPNDWVKRELEEALKLEHVKVIPVLVDCADMPKQENLPPEIKAMTYRQAEYLMFQLFDETSERLIRRIAEEVEKKQVNLDETRSKYRKKSIIIFSILGLLVILTTSIVIIQKLQTTSLPATAIASSKLDFSVEPFSGRPGSEFQVHVNRTRDVVCQKLHDDQIPDVRNGTSVDEKGFVAFQVDHYPGSVFEIVCVDTAQKITGNFEMKRNEFFYIISVSSVSSSDFDIDSELVSNAEFSLFVDSYNYEDNFHDLIPKPTILSRDGSAYTRASWLEAEAYCQWRLGSHLPTIAQRNKANTITGFRFNGEIQEWVRYDEGYLGETYPFVYYDSETEIHLDDESQPLPANPFTNRGFRCAKPHPNPALIEG